MKRPTADALAAIVLVAPFLLNDFANIGVHDWRWWLAIDYLGVKLFPLLVVAWLVRSGRLGLAELGLVAQPPRAFLITFLVVALLGTLIDQNGYRLLAPLPGYPALGGMPDIGSVFWNRLDLGLGLLMVGVVEELVFRGFVRAFLARFTRSRTVIVVASSLLFGAIHWSLGLHAVLVTAVIGAVFMVAYLRTRALPAIMLAHFAVDFVDFAGVIPKSLFRLMPG